MCFTMPSGATTRNLGVDSWRVSLAMRILFVAPQIPWPPDIGLRQRMYALLRAIARRHRVTLTAPARDGHEERIAGLGDLIERFLPAPDRTYPRDTLEEGRRWKRLVRYARDLTTTATPYTCRVCSPEWSALIAAKRDEFDAVVCRNRYVAVLDGLPRCRIVVDADDLNYMFLWRQARSFTRGWERYLLFAESLRSYLYEQRLFSRVARTLLCSEEDVARIHSPHTTLVRNGIDLVPASRLRPPEGARTIVFVGTFGYEPNSDGLRWFIREVWPLLQRRIPDVRLRVVGKSATAQQLPFAEVGGVDLIGGVRDVAEWICGAVLSVVPLRFGAGTRIKILESLGLGRLVVSTTIGAEGYADITEEHGLIRRDTPQEFAQAVAECLANPERTLSLGAAGRRLVEANYTWEKTTAPLVSDLDGGLRSSRRRPRLGSAT